jgi:diguanylate cyclase (GGDEF)-like protein/PAS domain S-box-containing protein
MDGQQVHPLPGLSIEERLTLRNRAEERFASQSPFPSGEEQDQLPQPIRHLLHELQVHQIELQMQNEELRRTQLELDTSQARYFDFYDLAPVGYCAVSDKGLIKQANLTTASMLGALRQALLGQPFSHFIEPEDQDVFYIFCRKLLDTRQSLCCELRLLHSNGTTFWVNLAAMAVPKDDGGSALRLVLSDITERKRYEAQLLLTASVFTHAREGITVTDAQGNILEVNAAFSRITGYSRAEALGNTPRILKSGRQDAAFYANMWNAVLNAGYWSGEIWNRRKDGEVYAELLTISSVRDVQGKVLRFIALFSDISDTKAHEQQIEQLAHFDALTNLPNRLLKADRLQQAMAQTRRTGQGLAVVYIDLDGFKTINDQHGHDAGDQMLIAVANHMKKVLREGDTLARLGGDEFVAVLINLGDIHACAPLLDRLLTAAAEPMRYKGHLLQVSASMGVTFFPQAQEMEGDLLLRQADQAMYQAKLAGKNRYHVFDTKQDNTVRDWHEDLHHMEQALQNNEFVLHYQPKVNLRTGQLVGAEALIRWQHPDKGLLAPAVFLPIVEEHALAIELGEWVIDCALHQIETWQTQGLHVPVSVNVGARQLQQTDFVARLRSLLARHPDVNPVDLTLEILETSALQDIAYVSQVIEDCRQMGVSFALDDFGTGYSSLIYLKRLRVGSLKIDQGFVRNMLEDPDDLAILKGIIGLALAFKHDVIAEGVETQEHGAQLLQLGCELAQGYGIARPMPPSEMPAWALAWQSVHAWQILPGC